jgi:hypothetical protein
MSVMAFWVVTQCDLVGATNVLPKCWLVGMINE